jgi:serine/threonine protein phosphatase 1
MKLESYYENLDGKDYVCGDIHGCYEELIAALDHIKFDYGKDRLFCVGDVVDRGTDNVLSISLYSCPWFKTVIGNHELMILNEYFGNVGNGNKWVYDMLTSGFPHKVRAVRRFQSIINELPSAIDIEFNNRKYGIIHAELPAGVEHWDEIANAHDARDTFYAQGFIWGRLVHSAKITVDVIGIDYLFTGHTIVKEPKKMGKQIFLDTGFYRTGKISIVDISTETINTITVELVTCKITDETSVKIADMIDKSDPL